LLPWEDKEKSGILITGEQPTPEIVKACFTLAQSLRDAKHVAEIDFIRRDPSDYRWVISISGKDLTRFTVTDCKQKQQQTVASPTEILSIVGG